MWLITTGGFVSAVQDPKNEDGVVVRARDKKSLETMLEGITLAGAAAEKDSELHDASLYRVGEIVTGQGTDYRWRTKMSKATFAIFVQYEVMNFLTYSNFKNALTESRGDVWHDAAMNVWVDMLAVDDGPKKKGRNGRYGSWGDLTGRPEPTDAELAEIDAAWGIKK